MLAGLAGFAGSAGSLGVDRRTSLACNAHGLACTTISNTGLLYQSHSLAGGSLSTGSTSTHGFLAYFRFGLVDFTGSCHYKIRGEKKIKLDIFY